jgi:hypothetical protein
MSDGGDAREVGTAGYDGPPAPGDSDFLAAPSWRAVRREAGGRRVLQIWRNDIILGIIYVDTLTSSEEEWLTKRLSILYQEKSSKRSTDALPHQEP